MLRCTKGMCLHFRHKITPGVDNMQEQGALLPGNDKKIWGNHNINVNGMLRKHFQLETLPLRKKTLCPPWITPSLLTWKCTEIIQCWAGILLRFIKILSSSFCVTFHAKRATLVDYHCLATKFQFWNFWLIIIFS